MLVFSDLDRSIIYSNKFLDTNIEYTNIEVYDGKEISYISKDSLEMIKQIQKEGIFIPTTTRTASQFNRIEFSKYNIEFPWVIASNGGVILNNGEILESWQNWVDKEVLPKSCPIEKVVELITRYKDSQGILKFRKAEELFFYLVVDLDIFNIEIIKEFTEILNHLGWVVYVSGRKIYFLPSGITKESAVKYLSKELGVYNYYAIGDSFMDEGMLSQSSHPYTFKHGELAEVANEKSFNLSNSCGMKGTEEVLNNVIEKGELNNELITVKV